MKALGIYYATACYRDGQGRYHTSSGLGRYLQVLYKDFPHIQVHLLAPTTNEALSHLQYALPERVQVYELPYFERLEQAREVGSELKKKLSRFFYEHSVDCLWLRYPAAYGTVLWQVAKQKSVPMFVEIVGDPVSVIMRTKRMNNLKKLLAFAVAKWHEREIEKVMETVPAIAVSRFLRVRYSTKRNQHNLSTLPCGSLFETDFFLREDTCQREPYRVLAVGRLDHMKSLHTLIDAVGILQQKGLPVCVDIVGSGPERDFLTGRAKQHLKEATWCLHGSVSDAELHQLYCTSDVFALPSIHEGLGRVYYEAMARGLPVVATWVDGIVDVVLDGVTGLLVPPSDPHALAVAIEAIIRRPNLRRRLIQNGYVNARRFTGEAFISGLMHWVDDTLGIGFCRE